MTTELQATTSLTLEDRIANRQRLSAMKKEIEKQLDAETAAIKTEFVERGIDDYPIDNETDLVLSVRDRSSLDKAALMEQGVTAEQIKKATKTSTYMQLDSRSKG